jgi:ribose/xylose/arabinose/galactoside ABC-type transport system permease subunit
MLWRKLTISVAVRTLFGLPLAAVLGVIGMAIASAMSVFFGVAALPTLLALLMVGAGIGAAIGAGMMMLRIDAFPSWPMLLAVALGLAVLSSAGGWLGFQVGDRISAIEDANCVGLCGYLFKPRTYIALGATLVPNCIAMAFNIAYEGGFRRWTPPRPRVSRATSAPGEVERR